VRAYGLTGTHFCDHVITRGCVCLYFMHHAIRQHSVAVARASCAWRLEQIVPWKGSKGMARVTAPAQCGCVAFQDIAGGWCSWTD
jgi:hypothetical protein